MYKKLIIFVVSAVLLLLLSVCVVYAEDVQEPSADKQQQQTEPWQNMPGGGKQGGFGGQRPNRENMQMPEGMEIPQGMPSFENGEFTPPEFSGESGFVPPNQDFANSQSNQQPNRDGSGEDNQSSFDIPGTTEQTDTSSEAKEQSQSQQGGRQNNFGSQRPSENYGNMTQNGQSSFDNTAAETQQTASNTFNLKNFVIEYQTPIISVVLLLFAFVFVKLYKRKNY